MALDHLTAARSLAERAHSECTRRASLVSQLGRLAAPLQLSKLCQNLADPRHATACRPRCSLGRCRI